MNLTKLMVRAHHGVIIFSALIASAGVSVCADLPTQAGAFEVSGVFGAAGNLPNLTSGLSTALGQVSSGFSVSGGSDFKWFVGGTAGYAISPSLLLVFESNYNRIGSVTVNYGAGTSAEAFNAKSSLTDFTGGMPTGLLITSTSPSIRK